MEDLMDTSELEKKAYDLGYEYEARYRNCAQCTIAAVQDTLGISGDEVFRSAGTMGGGIATCCDGPCGGYSGGAMMIGSLWGRRRDRFDGDLENKARSGRLALALHDFFVKEYGTVICREMHRKIYGRTFNLHDEADKAAFDAAGAHTTGCTLVVAKAAAATIRLILEEREREPALGE
jgi:C_GCAxxG_C_C family probable redox protein